MDISLEGVAQAGDINLFYTLIGMDPCLLDSFDNIPFVETPLHVAASLGHTQFAAEIMRLKPSFAEKPNQQGHIPLQVALQNGNIDTVRRLIAIDPQLIRVKGREGMTPLHFVAQNGDIELLNCFLSACPLSIMETTIRNETALHIAVKNRMFDAFNVLMGRLQRALHKGSLDQQMKILGMKDDDGNTLMHIAAQTNQPQVVKVLLNCRPKVNINEKSWKGLTAWDISVRQFPEQIEMNKMLQGAGALPAASVRDQNRHFNSKMSVLDFMITHLIRYKRNMSQDLLNVSLVVMVLIATVAYQAALRPPGGVWPGDDNSSTNRTSTNVSGVAHQPGTSIMSSDKFLRFWFLNTLTLLFTIWTILFLLPVDLITIILFAPLYMSIFFFGFSISIISPIPWVANLGSFLVVAIYILSTLLIIRFKRRHTKRQY